ncbi:uncharacterized protein M6B38_393920 [Iris pallida]|uniref:Uncharacterized protein n=1 Tax=Iris pallida TaxID=29817 RepID=A0AAX6FWP1_IRIPA|nr:uncharacterized protein M6B38_393920 [Iris pallida]
MVGDEHLDLSVAGGEMVLPAVLPTVASAGGVFLSSAWHALIDLPLAGNKIDPLLVAEAAKDSSLATRLRGNTKKKPRKGKSLDGSGQYLGSPTNPNTLRSATRPTPTASMIKFLF